MMPSTAAEAATIQSCVRVGEGVGLATDNEMIVLIGLKSLVAWIQGVALTLGGPGLFLIAFLDSSFLSLPQINDLLLVWMVVQHPHLMPYYALMAVLGSIAGCLVMYYIGRKGGDALLKKRFNGPSTERYLALFQRYGVLAVLVPSLLPPPAPFKIFVILAGVVRIPVLKFCAAIAIGRGIRYFGEGLLAVWFGQQAMAYVEAHGREVSLWLVGVIALGGLLYWLWARRRRPVPQEV
jgi:membrane protein YqaA with SNARE-associated domain